MELTFRFTPDEAQTIALAVHRHYRRAKRAVAVEERVEGAPYRPTLVASGGSAPTVYVDVHAIATVPRGFEDFVRWCAARRDYSQVYVATADHSPVTGTLMKQLQKEGIGLILVSDEGDVDIMLEGRTPALMVTPEPTLALGPKKKEVIELVERFNQGDRKSSLQDMCELVEQGTDALIRKAARKGVLNKSEDDVRKLSWSNQVDVLAADSAFVGARTALVSTTLKSDLDSFRGARNLLNHKVRTKKDKVDRERQFAERMIAGPRLMAEILRLQRRI